MVFVKFLVYLAILGVILVILGMMFPRKLFSYQAVVREKKVKNVMDGVHIPVPDYILYTEENQTVETKQEIFDSVKVGDTITVTFYSNGVHRVIEK